MEFGNVDYPKSGCSRGNRLKPAVKDADVDRELGDNCVSKLWMVSRQLEEDEGGTNIKNDEEQ